MANAVQKFTLSASRDIPFNKLTLSQANVRRVKAGVQSLTVRPVVDPDRVAQNVSHRFDGCLGDATIVASMICPLTADTAAKYAALWPAKNSVASKSKRS